MPKELVGELNAKGLRVAVVVARFNHEITDKLLEGVLRTLGAAGCDVAQVPVARVPGSLELAVVARKFALGKKYDAVICLGCVVRGETAHYDCVVNGATQGITAVGVDTGVPVIFGVLTCDTWEQALDRVDGSRKLHTGDYAAHAAIETANLLKKVESLKVKKRKSRKKARRDIPF